MQENEGADMEEMGEEEQCEDMEEGEEEGAVTEEQNEEEQAEEANEVGILYCCGERSEFYLVPPPPPPRSHCLAPFTSAPQLALGACDTMIVQ